MTCEGCVQPQAVQTHPSNRSSLRFSIDRSVTMLEVYTKLLAVNIDGVDLNVLLSKGGLLDHYIASMLVM